VHTALIEQIIEHPAARAEEALALADDLLSSIVDPVKTYRTESLTASVTTSQAGNSTAAVELTPSAIGAKLSSEAQSRVENQNSSSFAVETDDKVVFPTLHGLLSRILQLSSLDLYILLDEWSSVPQDIQPYLAEFLKRGVLPVSACVLKIASLEYRSHFNTRRDGGELIGFELGADISTAQDLDDYYVFDRNPDQIATIYADMLLRHLAIELPEHYLADSYRASTGEHLASKLFTERATFNELARASEGVVRDLINIFTLAFFHAHRRGRASIDRRAVLEAARQWFEQDKAQHLDEKMHTVLRRIVDEVIGERKARSFLLPRELEKNALIQRLFDQRLLHQMQRGYADKDNPGVRYNIYSLDYGTSVDLMGTIKQPQIDLDQPSEAEEGQADLVVPFDDKRSIRRVILTQAVLE
jgi:hypothetical protein